MAGKSGGFFKRLKIKQQKAVKKASRGTSGRTKADRRARHNSNVDLYAAKRQLEQLEDAEHSSASIDDEDLQSSSSSDFGPISQLGSKQKNPLSALVSLMDRGAKGENVAGGALSKGSKTTATRSKRAENLSDDEEDFSDEEGFGDDSIGSEDPDGDALDALLTQQEQEELRALEEEAEEEEDEEFGEEGEEAMPESQWDDLFAGVAGTGVPAKQGGKGGRNLALAGKAAAASDDDDDEEGDEEYEGEEGEEEEEEDNESDFHSNASASAGEVESDGDEVEQPLTGKKALAEEEQKGLYLPDFALTAAATASVQEVDSKALGVAVVRHDPWYKRFYAAKADPSSKASALLAVDLRSSAVPIPSLPAGIPYPLVSQPPTEMRTLASELSVSGTSTAANLLQHIVQQEKRADEGVVGGKRSRDAPTESAPEGHHPPFIHATIWTAWCGYRYKIFLEQQKLQQSLSTPGGGAVNDDLVASCVELGELAPTPALLEACGRLSDSENAFFNLLQTYSDVMDNTNRWETTFAKRSLVALHLLNHWCKSKSLVAAHNQAIRTAAKTRKAAKQAKRAAGAKKEEGAEEEEEVPMLEFRDQGFGKTRLMVVLPMRNLALELVETIVRILHSTEGLPRTPKEVVPSKMGKVKKPQSTAPARPDMSVRDILADTMGHELAMGVVRNGDPYRIHESSKLLPATVETSATRPSIPTSPHDLIALADRAYHFISPKAVKKLEVFRRDFSEIEEALLLRTFRKRHEDFRRTFYGNMDDSFCFGISLGLPMANPTSKSPCASAVYSHVLNSDILICSPLGLRKRLQRNADILVSLSSIEVLLVGEVQGLLMQNWDHLAEVLKLLNVRPKDTTQGLSPISRIYDWAIRTTVQIRGGAGAGAGTPQPIGGFCRRQNIFMSTVANATSMATYRSQQAFLEEGAGKREPLDLFKTSSVVVAPIERAGVLNQVTLRTRQLFMRYQPTSITTADDERFTYFTKTLFRTKLQPLIDRDVRCIIVVPSYFDFTRLRTHFLEELRESVAFLNEYSTDKQQRKVLGQFSDQEKCLLIMTERFYYFKRYFVRMAEQLVFYAPPVTPHFYPALVNKLNDESPHVSVSVIFGRYDSHELVRLVGTDRCKQLLERESDVFAFVTEA